MTDADAMIVTLTGSELIQGAMVGVMVWMYRLVLAK